VTKTKKGYLNLDEKAIRFVSSRADYSENNLYRALIRQFYLGYGKDKTPQGVMAGLSLDEFKGAYKDLQGILEDRGLVSQGDESFYKRMSQESNLFLPSSNGDTRLSLAEFTEYIRFSLSTLKQGRKVFDEEIKPYCEDGGERHLFKNCFGLQFKRKYAQILQNSPALVKYFKSAQGASANELGAVQRKFLKNVYKAVGAPENQRILSRKQVIKIIGLFNYMESIFKRFDKNKDQHFSYMESHQAYVSTFRTVIEEMPKLKDFIANYNWLASYVDYRLDDGYVKELGLPFSTFTFLLNYGRLPLLKVFKLGDKSKFNTWTLSDDSELEQEMISTRLEASAVMALVATESNAFKVRAGK